MAPVTTIPFVDLVAPHVELEGEILQVVRQALRTAGFIGGPMLEEFERAFAGFCGTRYAVGVNSGTDALRFALMAAGVGQGHAVLTVPNTFIATGEAISQAGALPEFVDVDPRTYNMDVQKLAQYLERECMLDGKTGKPVSKRTGRMIAAVVPVHLYGQVADMDGIRAVADRYGLVVIEDACQAHGAQFYSREENRQTAAGSLGLAGAFSFYPGKNLGACGEAGAVTTNDEELARKIRMIRDHGQGKKYYHDMEGYNGRLDAIQAGILSVKLKHLAKWNEARRNLAQTYNNLFSKLTDAVVIPYEPSWSRAVFHLYVIRVSQREQLQKRLAESGIGTGIHYPIPLHLQAAYRELGYQRGDFPVAEAAAEGILSLPMFPTLRTEQVEQVVNSVVAHANTCARAQVVSVSS